MPFHKKLAKTISKAVTGAKKSTKRTPAFRLGQVAGSLARGKTPKRKDMLGAALGVLGIRTRPKQAKKMKKPLRERRITKKRGK